MTASSCHVVANRQPLMRELGLDAQTIFTHPDIHVWRELPDRQNATLEAVLADGGNVRLHIKRYPPARGKSPSARAEAQGIQLLRVAGISTSPLIAWGNDQAGRSFVVTEDLAGRRPLDKLIAEGLDFSAVSEATAELAAKLHSAGLHHRDLYLCHFFAQTADPPADLALIDAARVRRLPGLFVHRWVVKDLAQFWYSALQLKVSVESLSRWLGHYVAKGASQSVASLQRRVERKAAWIGRHDRRLVQRQPGRNISIPSVRHNP